MYSEYGSFVADNGTSDQRSEAAIAQLTNGSVVVAWKSANGDGDSTSVKAAILTPDGATIDVEFQVNSVTAANQELPTVTALPSGNFLVSWTSYGTGNSGQIRAQIFSPVGAAVGGEFTVNSFDAGTQSAPVVAVLSDGRFVVAYESINESGVTSNIRARLFDAAGAPLGSDFIVETGPNTPSGSITKYTFDRASITDLAGGGFVISWTEARQILGPGELPPGHFELDVKARAFGANGLPVGNEFLLSVGDAGATQRSSVFALASGGFVAVWEIDKSGTSQDRIEARIFDAAGTPAGPEFQLAAQVELLRVTPLPDGGFMLTIRQGAQAWLQAYDETGTAVDQRIPIAWSPSLTDDSIVALADGRLLDASGGAHVVVHALAPPADLPGGPGDDTYVVKNPDDVIHEAAGQGYDVVYATVSYALAAGQEIEALATSNFAGTGAINLTGNEIANYLIGNEGANVLNGGAGADAMDGRGGNDTYIVDNAGDQVIEAVGKGYDVIYASVSYTLGAGQEVEALATSNFNGTTALNFTGNELANYLVGNAGENVLSGGGGADVLEGRGGNDTYIVDNVGDQVIEAAGQGYDVVYSSISYTLTAGQEIEALATSNFAGTAALSLTGNELANYIVGNAGDNTLSGGAGADALEGRGGNDTYVVDNAGDQVVEGAGQGYDVVYASASYTLGAGQSVEALATSNFAGTGALNLTGNELANYLIGNEGANTLNGGAGSDALDGRGGADTFVFANALGPNNVDQILGFSSVDDTIQLDHNVFSGLGVGGLNPNAFVVGTQAGDGNDRIIYDQATGNLYFDADGAGGSAQILFATLTGNPVLSASDFVVI